MLKWDVYRVGNQPYRVAGDICEYYLWGNVWVVSRGISATALLLYPLAKLVAKNVIFKVGV